ncbi:MAG TPA: CCA tRNA nucleotidyltransferase [Acidimicrobiales bacterium]
MPPPIDAEHHHRMISPELLEEVRPLAELFQSAGFRLYLVGGIVRDQVLGRPLEPSTDIDLTTDASPDRIKELLAGLARAVWTQGERFGTIGCHIGARAYEITTHRGEWYEPSSRKPMVEFSDAVEDDLARRDFTVNAMAASLPDGALIDPHGGLRDLAEHRLRTPLEPEQSFTDDPLRMLRAARFLAGYDLVPEPALVDAVDRLVTRLSIVSIERRRDELDKLLVVPNPTPGFRFLRDHNVLGYVLVHLAGVPGDAFERVLHVMQRVPPDRDLRLAATFAADDAPVRAEVASALRDLRYSNHVIERVSALVVAASMARAHDGDWRPADVRRLASVAGSVLDDAVVLASALVDTTTLREQIRRLRATEPLDDLTPALDGEAVMELLGVPPGPDVGRALDFLRELRVNEGVLAPDDARRRLDEWWRSTNVDRG